MSSSFPTKAKGVRGKLKVFLGYAAGVGKTYQMLQEGHQLKLASLDVAVGYFEPHARPDTMALLAGLELIPRQVIEYRGTRFEEMDTEAILARRPRVCLVDEFPHTNVPGLRNGKRWEDVLVLLEHGIDVLTTMNVQHLESLNDQIYNMTGVRVRETVPDWVLQQAEEVVMVDLTPRALLNRLDRGVIYQGDKAQRAKEHFFKEYTLVALRELALRETAFEVREQGSRGADSEASRSSENVLAYITPDKSSAALIRRGKRVADYLQVQCFAVAVSPDENLGSLPAERKQALEKHLQFARNLHIDARVLQGTDAADVLMSFARKHSVTQIYLARPARTHWSIPFAPDIVQRIVRLAGDMEVTIVAERSPLGFVRSSSTALAGARHKENN
jgi:two-component system, OmpR family, sensor histidine kinase KdpD